MVLQVLLAAIYNHHLNLQIKTGNSLKGAIAETEVKHLIVTVWNSETRIKQQASLDGHKDIFFLRICQSVSVTFFQHKKTVH